MPHYNTTNLEGEPLAQAKMKAITQEDIILEIFHHYKELSPSQCWQKYHGFCTNVMKLPYKSGTPLTSIRRAIHDLTSEGYLERTDKKVTGTYGAKEYVWKLLKS